MIQKGLAHRFFHWVVQLATSVINIPQVSNEKNPGWLGYIGDYTTQLYRDYFINHYKDPY